MAEGDTPYRFENGQWEVWDDADEAWFPAGPEAAAILRGYTKVKDIGQGRLVFYAENGDTMTEEVLLNQIEQMDEADRLENAPWWGPEVTAAFGPYQREHPKLAQALNYAQDLKIPGTPGVATTPAPPPLIFDTKAKADAEAALNGGVVVRRDDGRWGVEDSPTQKQVYPGQVIKGETIGGSAGSYFLQDPSGNLTPYTPPASFTDDMPPETFEETFTRYLVSGQREKAQQLWDAREAIIRRGGEMSDAEIAQFLTGDLFKAEEMPALIEALRRGPTQWPTAQEPQRLTSGPLAGLDASLLNPDLQWKDAQGNPIESPFAATLANRPFPGAPPGAGDTTTPGFGVFNPQAALEAAQPLAPAFNAQAQEEDPEGNGMVFTAQGEQPQSFTQAIQADLEAVTNAQRAQLQGVTQQEGLTGEAASSRPAFTDALRRREAQLAGVGPSGQPLLSAQGGNVPQNQRAFPGLGAGATIADVLRQAQGGDVAGARANAQSLVQQGFAARTQEPVIPESTFADVVQTPRALTFEQALEQRNQRLRHRQLLRMPQGRTIYA